jgi:ribosomal protein S18 acetylase RimI-like enzyme
MGAVVASTIRPARTEDADFIVRTILAAQRGPHPRGWFDIALARPESEVFAFVRQLALARCRSWWHVSQFLIAEVEGSPAAALCALPSAGTIATARAALEEAAQAIGLNAAELAAMYRRGAYSGNCWVQGGHDDWLIEHVASQPSYRGGGLVQALIGRALDAGRAAGYKRASISFLIGNEPAERCYAKAGFSFAEEKRDSAFEALTGAPGFRRFERRI